MSSGRARLYKNGTQSLSKLNFISGPGNNFSPPVAGRILGRVLRRDSAIPSLKVLNRPALAIPSEPGMSPACEINDQAPSSSPIGLGQGHCTRLLVTCQHCYST